MRVLRDSNRMPLRTGEIKQHSNRTANMHMHTQGHAPATGITLPGHRGREEEDRKSAKTDRPVHSRDNAQLGTITATITAQRQDKELVRA